MDIRHFAFLGTQPSARLQPREHFWGLPKRGLALILANALFWQPLLANAEGIVVSAPGTSLGAAGNGVPIVNIAAPNGSGLSHNQFKDYNVGANGVILNNATERTQPTQLGGIILGNPNLQGRAANIILNEVNGGSPSQLRGYTEVAGQSAKVIVANPYGISCNGCGFINTPNVTLTTGKPILDNGRLDRYQVDGGAVTIDGQGLNASNVDRFEIITRSAKINAQINARNLTVIAGRNDVNAQTLNATARAEDGSAKPELAIDSSALGGMYAGAIKLVGTEAGVGVKLDGTLAASGGDIQLDANGRLSLANAKASEAVVVKAGQLDATGAVYAGTRIDVQTTTGLSNQKSLAARDSITLTSSGQVNNNGIIEAGVNADESRNTSGDVSLSAASLTNTQSVIASGTLSVTTAQNLDNQTGALSGSKTRLSAGQIDNRGGLVLATDSLTVNTATTLDNRAGKLLGGNLNVIASGAIDNRLGIFSATSLLTLQAASLDNSGKGTVVSQGNLTATLAGLLDNSNEGNLISQGAQQVSAGQLNNTQAGLVSSKTTLALHADTLANSAGLVIADGALALTGGRVDNSHKGVISSLADIRVELASLNNSEGGKLSSAGRLALNATEVDNSAGRISAKGELQATVGVLTQQAGELVSEGALSLTAASLDNRNGGLVAATQGVDLRSQTVLNSLGEISSQAKVQLVADDLNNNTGKVIGDGGLALTVQRLLNQSKGLLAGRESLVLNGAQLDNSGGRVTSQKDLNIQLTGDLLNQDQGTVLSEGALTVKAAALDNRQGGILSAANALSVTTSGQLNNQAGKLLADGTATLVSAALNNSQGGVISAKGSIEVHSAGLNNSQKGSISTDAGITLNAGQLDNSKQGSIFAKSAIKATLTGLDQQDRGELVSDTGIDLDLNHGSLINRDHGLIATPGQLLLKDLGRIDNSGGGEISSSQSFLLAGDALNNRGGKVISGESLQVRVANALDNRSGLINSQGDLTLAGQRVDSSQGGEISAKGDLKLTVQQLIQRQGRLIGERAVSIDLQGGDLDNRAGLISAKGPLTFARLANLTNREGAEISSQTAFTVAAQRIDNGDRGVILSADQLRLEAETVVNADKGLLSGWNGLTVVGGNLDNSAEGTLSSKSGTLQTTLTGALDNHAAGALVSQGKQSISVASLNNDQGIISGQADVSLSVAGRLDNSNSGLIFAGQHLGFNNAQSDILNRGGQVSAANITLIGQSLDNSAGQLISQGTLQGTLSGALINANNARLASGAALLLNAASLDNRGGQLVSQDRLDLTLANGDLDNSAKGTLASQKDLVIKLLAGDIHNRQDGLMFSQLGTLELTARTLNNQQGRLQSQADNRLRLSGALNNHGGRVDSLSGNLDLASASVANTAGGLLNSSKGAIKLATGLFDNGGGGVYADTLLKVTATDFDNQGTAAGNGGKVGARSIDFGLTGTLNNRFGLIESDDTLRLAAQTLNNADGNLRAMGRTGTTDIKVSGVFDNRSGALESANENLNLQATGLDNNGGRIVHTGSGQFDLTSDQVTRAGGSFVTNGQLDVKAASWTNSSVIQAGRLNLDIGQLIQTSSGLLLGTQSLTGTGDTWTNDGLLASDGTLNLTLTGGYSGNGRVSSLGAMTLTSARMDLGENARIAGGALTQVNSTTLNNHGRLTALGDLTVNATTLNNYGTLGGAEKVRLNATHLLNDKGLLFSGNDMTLRVNDFSNRYGDVYSLGGLDIARDDAGTRSSLIENVSGSLESAGNLRLFADTLSNRRDQFTTEKKLVSGNLNIYSNDYCKGKGCELYFTSVEKYEDVMTGSSASAFINAGGDLTVGSQTFDNLYSSVSAAKNILINTDVLTNRGAAGGEERHFNSGLYTRDRGIYNTFIDRQNQFNTYNNPNSGDYRPGQISMAQVMAGVGNFYESSSYVVPTAGSVIAQAVIQAAGLVTVNATSKIDNSVIRPNATDLSTPAQHRNTDAEVFASTVKPAITAQLPPDLAQRQVNPATLPGFSLPTGQNGLFRLSGQQAKADGAANASTANGDFTVGGRQVAAKDREKPLDYSAVQERGFSLDGQPPSGTVNGQAPREVDGRAPTVTRVQGLPDIAPVDNSHKYLIETNPALTDLKQFMSSDYLLGKLGYNPDTSWKRLGDGLYEQRLIREAVVARTGQRYIDGIASDDALFRYLMDNAIAYKDSLHLQLGVSLSAEQVAALTHDIVWMEEAEVNGQKVLTPVLYLAQANNRLAPNGALIQGQDVSLISGGDLHNSGTLRATNNLSMVAANIDNSGLMQAGNRLEMLATDSIRNTRGGIVTGRDISATAVTGDIINERTVTTFKREGEGYQLRNDVTSEASRFEATDTLKLNAGRDVINVGSHLKAGGNASVTAGRDVVIASQTEQDDYAYQRRRVKGNEQTTLQHASAVDVGGNLAIDARRDIAVIASTVSAAKDLSVKAGESLTLSAAANEEHTYSKGKKGDTKTTTQLDKVTQQSAELKAGGDLIAIAGTDLTLIASKISAGNEAYVHADSELQLLAAQDSHYSLYDMSKKGGWGSKKTQRDEVTDVKNVGSEIKTGGDLTLESGGDQKYQAAKLDSGGDIAIVSGGAVTFEAVKDLRQESHEKSNNNAFWVSSKGKGNTDETLRQTRMVAEGNIAIKAVEGLKIDVKQVNQQTVSQSIDAMVKADPQLAWIKDAEARGDVDWRQVKEIHDSFKYSNSGLGPASQIIIAIVMAAVVGPLAAVAAGGGTAGAVVGAVAAGASTNASVSAINNRGNLGAVLKDVTSSDAVKGYVISGATAGLTTGYFGDWTGTQTNTLTGKVTTQGLLNTWSGVGKFAANQTLQSGTSMLLSKALGQGGSASDALKSALFNTLAAASFNLVGNYTEGVIADGSAPKIAIHAMVGGLLAEATGGDFKTGALAAGANEALVTHLNALVKGNEELLTMSSQIVGVLAAAGQKDADAAKLEKGAWVAKNATQYNYLGDHQKAQREKELAESKDSLEKLRINTKWELIDVGQDASFAGGAVVGVPEGLLDTVKGILEVATSPRETYRALRAVLVSGDVPGIVSESIKQSYITRIDNLEAEYERAGASGSFNAGREAGKLISDVVALGTGVGGALKSGALLVEKVTAKVVKAELAVAKATGEVATTVPRTPLGGPTGNWKNYTHAEAVIQTQASGRLVNAEKAVIDPSKVTSYALNTAHPVGGNKAKVFESALGYNQTNAASLITKVQEGAKLYPAKLGASDKFGQRITIDMPIKGPNGNTATVRTGWIYDPGSATPRMTTLYVK